MLLAESDTFTWVGEATDGLTAIRKAELLRPDLVLMNADVPQLNGIEAAHQITGRFPQIGVVIISDRADGTSLERAFQAGARAYLLTTEDSGEILNALRAVHAGQRHVSPALTDLLAELLRRPPSDDPLAVLTGREREVIQLILAGRTSREAGQLLGISTRTVEVHRHSVMQKLGFKNLAQLLDFMSKHRLSRSHT
jgi:DNA-binding NarL/FixJ family response regulator